MNKLLKGNDKFFLFKLLYNSRIIQEYFQTKIGRKIGIFSLARKNNILILKKVYKFSWQFKISRFHLLIFINVTIYTFLRYDCLASSIFWSFANFFHFKRLKLLVMFNIPDLKCLDPFQVFCVFILSPILSLKEETLKTPLISVPNPSKFHLFSVLTRREMSCIANNPG